MKKKKMNILIILGIILAGWFLYSWLPVRNIEEPKYSVVTVADGYEIREYRPYIIAQTSVAQAKNRNDAARIGFPILAGYIFGDNTKKNQIAMTVPVNTQETNYQQIAMTVPVNTEQEEEKLGTYKVSFVLPSGYTLETLPTPNDTRVQIIQIPARKIAVRKFSWSALEGTISKNEEALLSALKRDGNITFGSVNVARYNTPWTIPFLLRTEVQIQVK